MINIALLCGSDYTLGVQRVGPVSALATMAEFPGEGIQGLVDFNFAREKIGWRKEKVDENLLPVMLKMNEKQSQGRIDKCFQQFSFHKGSFKINKCSYF
ncbi:DNA repair protein complementing XP-G cells-like [Mizuhopecten yessoensis]|uniref:DNA repair protein complementing XP-G cells-like n=1 Tax=Mizuhopecten yessoensis TaxID=6573 RepID=A0A210PIQ7_MIZYE|nr:DNA repair protein complementing XP-G cells-like [Mizuhopecten yessoensis]